MNLRCPNCQKMLAIDNQYSGQLMRCPLCNGTFTVPALAPEPLAAAVASGPTDAGGYALADSPPLTPPSPTETIKVEKAASSPAPEAPSIPPAGYTTTRTFLLNPDVLPWIAPVCLVLVFFFSFFNWDGLYPGGYGVYTQSAWGSAFHHFTTDAVGEKVLGVEEALHNNSHASWVLVLFLLVFLPLLAVAIASVVVPRLQIKLPPAAQQVMPWKSAIIAGGTALALVLLLFQLLLGLGLENGVANMVKANDADQAKAATTSEDFQMLAIREGARISSYRPERTFVLRMTVFLSLVAIAGAGLDFWVERRGNRPRPRLEVSW